MNEDYVFFFFSSRRRHTRLQGDWSSDVCSSDLADEPGCPLLVAAGAAQWGGAHLPVHREPADVGPPGGTGPDGLAHQGPEVVHGRRAEPGLPGVLRVR